MENKNYEISEILHQNAKELGLISNDLKEGFYYYKGWSIDLTASGTDKLAIMRNTASQLAEKLELATDWEIEIETDYFEMCQIAGDRK